MRQLLFAVINFFIRTIIMRIGIDIMGGDYAPEQTVLGSIAARKELSADVTLVLIGDSQAAKSILEKENVPASQFEFVHCDEVIGMAEHPTKAIQQKQNSSIAVGFHLLKEGKIDSFASAGNTGAMLVGSMFSVKAIPGILRPAIASLLPKENGGWGLILDVGVNADCKPEVLQQFAMIGSIYAQNILHIKEPRVGLMSIGEEEEKGNKNRKTQKQQRTHKTKTTNNIQFPRLCGELRSGTNERECTDVAEELSDS